MKQLGVKLPEEDMNFLEWYSQKYATPKSVVYRETTLDAFKSWKHHILLRLYIEGSLGFKQFCSLGNISLLKGMQLIETGSVDPVIPVQLDYYTDELLSKNLKDTSSLLKSGTKFTRSTP